MRIRRQALVVLIAATLYLGPLVLGAPLTDPDEGLHASISQEMLDRGDFIVPRFLGTAFLDKPILFFWAQAASIAAFGATTAAARLPGALFALLGILTTGWLAREMATGERLRATGNGLRAAGFALPAGDGLRDTGMVAAACYATMLLPFLLAQAPVHDIALVPFANVALGLLSRARFRTAMGAGVALGLSILTKGLEGVAIVGVGYAAYLILARRLTPRIVIHGVTALAVAAVIALPWYLAMNAREPGYLRYYFVDRHLLGFATDTQRHGGQPWWFYLPVVVAGGLPWVLFVRRGSLRSATLLPWTWLVAGTILLSLSGSKTVTYILPVMPAVAILAASSAPALRWWRPVALATAALYAVVLVTAGPSVAQSHSARDLAQYFNATGRVPPVLFVMDQRVSFVYYLRADLRRTLRDGRVRMVNLDELAAMPMFPAGAVLALPADLAEQRLPQIPALAHATRIPAGRYELIGRSSTPNSQLPNSNPEP